MKNMSFMLTQEQFRNRTKTVTRRLGWWNLKPGEIVMGVEKSQGLRKGEKIVRMGPIRIVSVRLERIGQIVQYRDYGLSEVALEGFPGMTPCKFEKFFFTTHKGCTPKTEVNRIEFEYL